MFCSTLKKSAFGLVVVVAAVAAAIAPAGASAATITHSGAFLDYTAAHDRTNDLRVTLDSTMVTFMENNSDQVTSAPAQCLRYDWGVRCPLSSTIVRVRAGTMHDRLVGTINSGQNGIELHGDGGSDLVDVTGAADERAFIYGEQGDDKLYGRQFGDTIYGGEGADILSAGGGSDTLNGGPGVDRIDGGSDRDYIYARDRTRDRVQCGTGSDWAQVDRVWPVRDYLYPGCETLG